MAAAGCRVVAPSLPGFGGTAELGADQRSFTGYGRWVGRFLDAIGEDHLALVAGHSFGGGVATAFVSEQPDRVSSLLLANAVGSPTWALFPNEVRTMVQRPVWDWGRHFGRDVLWSPRGLRLLPRLLADLVPNHLVDAPIPAEFAGRAMACQRLSMIGVECVARGYLAGSGVKDYRASGAVCGIPLPPGLREGDQIVLSDTSAYRDAQRIRLR